jgi:hypothetical protein
LIYLICGKRKKSLRAGELPERSADDDQNESADCPGQPAHWSAHPRAHFPMVIEQLAAWARAGAVYREDIEEGLDRAPHALAAIYRGENSGKKIIRLEGLAG